MPNISKPASVDSAEWRARIGMVACTLLFVAVATAGISRGVAAKASPPDHVVKIENMKFTPATLRVHVGARVEFQNADLVPHTATTKSGTGFDSGLVPPGGSWTLNAKAAGSFSYVCTYHPAMLGEIIVEERK